MLYACHMIYIEKFHKNDCNAMQIKIIQLKELQIFFFHLHDAKNTDFRLNFFLLLCKIFF